MASNLLNSVRIASPITRTYNNLRGVDFMNEPTRVSLQRSPDALNVYKDYTDGGECIQTRPGYRVLRNFENEIYGFYFFEHDRGRKIIVHAGKRLYDWTNYPDDGMQEIYSDMNESKSVFLVFTNVLYILDGKNYLYYDGETLGKVKDISYVPTTTIGREPNGGGTDYQPANVLQTKRKNQFVANGTSTEFVLDAVGIDSDEVIAWVEDLRKTEGIDFTVNRALGKIIFNTAPAKSILGKDNVIIQFSKTIEGYNERIEECTLAQAFDNRIFYSGNKRYNNALFHCKLDNPTYVSDLDYYQDGLDSADIKSLVVGNNVLWALKNSNQQNNTIFYHTPTLDNANGRIYPSAQGNISTGCNSEGINFNDDIVFLTKQGLQGISSNSIESEQILSHRSTLVDSKMINLNDYDLASLTEWQGYLIVLVNGKMFVADSRQMFNGTNGVEYEWYYWEFASESKIKLLREYKSDLYIGFENGDIAILGGSNDNGNVIQSYWTTPFDLFESENHFKTTNKRGGIVNLKTIPNSKVKVAVKTNKKENYELKKELSMNGFDYERIDYSNWDYSTTNQGYVIVKIKEKKIIDMSLKIYTDELDRPIGLYGMTIEAYLGGYIKR